MFGTVLNISEDRTKQMCEITKECSLSLRSFTTVDDLHTTERKFEAAVYL